jgi:hypothetical protein
MKLRVATVATTRQTVLLYMHTFTPYALSWVHLQIPAMFGAG